MPVVLARWYRGRASLQSGAMAFAPAPCISAAGRSDRVVIIDRRIRPRAEGEFARRSMPQTGQHVTFERGPRREAAMVSFLTTTERPFRVVKTGKAPCEQMFSAVHPTTDIAKILRHVRLVPILLQKSFWGEEQKFLEPLMRLTRGDVRDHIVSSKIDHGPS